jgi:hypothetical protein
MSNIIFNINNEIIYRNNIIININNIDNKNIFNINNFNNNITVFSRLKWWKNIHNKYINKLNKKNKIITEKWLSYLTFKSLEWECPFCKTFNLGNKSSWGRTKCYTCNTHLSEKTTICTKRLTNHLYCDI